jgi:hypothetical protein
MNLKEGEMKADYREDLSLLYMGMIPIFLARLMAFASLRWLAQLNPV